MINEQPTWYMLGMSASEMVHGSSEIFDIAVRCETRSAVLRELADLWGHRPIKLAYFSAMYMSEAQAKSPEMVGDVNPLYKEV